MPFSLCPFRRLHVPLLRYTDYSSTTMRGPFQDQGTVRNLSFAGWRLSGDLPMRPGEPLSLTVTLPNEQRVEVPQTVGRWSRGQEFLVENVAIESHTEAQPRHYMKHWF